MEKVVKDLFKEESKRMTVINTPIRLIKAADSPSSADQMAGDLLENMDKDGGEFFETGFDVEGKFATTHGGQRCRPCLRFPDEQDLRGREASSQSSTAYGG